MIVASYNTRHLLDDCLRSLQQADKPPAGLEIIVVDNASTDGSQSMVSEKYPGVRLIACDTNRGFSAANNQGTAVARGQYILFLNSDTRVSKEALVKPLEHLRTHPEVGAITVHLVYPTGQRDPDNHRGFPTPWNALCHFLGLGQLLPNSRLFNGYFQSYEDFTRIHPIDVIAGSFMMMPAELCRSLGGWDEDYFFYGEDIDLCYRIRQAGYQILYFPCVEVLHYKGASSGLRRESADIAKPAKATRVRVARESVRSMKIFYQKFYKRKYPRWLTAIVLTGIQLRGWFRIVKHRLT